VDRLPPGDGVIDWGELFGLLSAIGYRGYLSYEAPNPELWHQSPHAVAQDGIRKTREMLARQRVPSI
jgi:sugar phosphate isomerase/epimerase